MSSTQATEHTLSFEQLELPFSSFAGSPQGQLSLCFDPVQLEELAYIAKVRRWAQSRLASRDYSD